MGKNNTISDSVNGIKITQDESFKHLIRFKGIAAIIVKCTIPYFKDMSLVEISRSIIDINRGNRSKTLSDTEILEDEIDFLPSESGTKDEKNTIQDATFRMRINKELIGIELRHLDTTITVNTEMQNKTKNLGYDIVSRAIYYGATLLRDTLSARNTKYSQMHKVYTVWLCGNNIESLQGLPGDNIETKNLFKDQYIHRFGIRRFYDAYPNQIVPPEREADLMEIVIVELSKIRRLNDDSSRLIKELFFNTNNIPQVIEQTESVSLLKLRKGVITMLDFEKGQERAKAEAKEETLVEVAANMIQVLKLTSNPLEQIIAKIKPLIGCNNEIIEKAYNQLITKS